MSPLLPAPETCIACEDYLTEAECLASDAWTGQSRRGNRAHLSCWEEIVEASPTVAEHRDAPDDEAPR